MHNLEKRLDGSYTFTKNGHPYNCPNIGEWVEEYTEVHAWALANPDQVTYEQPPTPLTPKEEQALANEQAIAEHKAYLSETDWVVIKCTESPEEKDKYTDVFEARAYARSEINRLEA